jgi:hypothetical protein
MSTKGEIRLDHARLTYRVFSISHRKVIICKIWASQRNILVVSATPRVKSEIPMLCYVKTAELNSIIFSSKEDTVSRDVHRLLSDAK